MNFMKDLSGGGVKICFKKVKNKTTTIIANVEDCRKSELCKQLKKQLGCGGSIDKDTGHIILQGNHVNKLLEQKNELFPGMEVVKVENL